MPAKSQKQQKLMGMAYAYKKGELKNPPQEVIDIADSMTLEQLKDYAQTKHTNLPEKVASGEKMYFFEGRNTAVVAKSEEEARSKKKRGGDKLVVVRDPDEREQKKIDKGEWVRTRADGKPPGKSDMEGPGYGPPLKKKAEIGKLLGELTLRRENPTGISGPLPHAAVKALLGAGAGYGVGHILDNKYRREIDKKRTRRKAAVIGALLGSLSSYPDIRTQLAHGRRGKIPGVKSDWSALNNPYPFKKQSFDTSSNLDFGKLFAPKSHVGAKHVIASDAVLSPIGKLKAMSLVDEAERGSEAPGMFTTVDLVRAGIAGGLGYGGGALTGKALGAVFGMPPKTQKRLAQAGAVGAILKATGIWE